MHPNSTRDVDFSSIVYSPSKFVYRATDIYIFFSLLPLLFRGNIREENGLKLTRSTRNEIHAVCT